MRVFLSPSNQPHNRCKLGHSEKAHCDELVRKMIPLLKENGIEYKLRNPNKGLISSVNEATAWGANLYIPIHTNAGGARGTRFGYYPLRRDSARACTVFKNNWIKLYPFIDKVKTCLYLFGEARRPKCPSVYCELIFHDNIEDAKWFHANMDKIANNLVQSILQLNRKVPYYAEVVTSKPLSLNIWKGMSKTKSLGKIPKGALVKVLEEVNSKWARIEYRKITGYCDRAYLR